MPYIETTATRKIKRLNKRVRLLAGGMRASKTISVLLYLIAKAQTDSEPTLTSVVSESFPHLRRGAMRDFESIMQQHGYWRDARWSKTEYIYTFESGSKIEFFSADQPQKIRGPSRDRLFVNEANNIAQESWEQLLFRTREFAFADWNPVGDFYLYQDYGLNDDPLIFSNDDRVDFLVLTYKDNEALEPTIVEDIERKAAVNSAWARVYAKGLRGENESNIFKKWPVIDSVPHEARLEVRGMDFGFSKDPTAICDIYYYNGGYIVDELAYRVGMLNRQAADILLNQPDPNVLTIADSSDGEGIAAMNEMGVNIIPVVKRSTKPGQNFTNNAFDFVNSQQISITKRSTNFIKSNRNFQWQFDKDGNQLDKYDHFWSDGMMAVTYGMTNFDSSRQYQQEEESATTGNLAALWD